MRTLKQIYNEKGYGVYPTDKDTTHCYLDTYDWLFAPFQDKEINVLEMGVSEGGSLRLWADYFSKAKIYGYDIAKIARPECVANERITYVIKDINKIVPGDITIPLTIAVDDGSHLLVDQLHFIKLFYPSLVEGGLLIVEDVQNVDSQKQLFKALGLPFTIIDLRNIKGRYDDVLLIFQK